MPFHGVRLPVNRWGNLMGNITASFNDALAPSRPATSSHLTCGLSDKIAPESPALNFFVSGSTSPSSSSFLSTYISVQDFVREYQKKDTLFTFLLSHFHSHQRHFSPSMLMHLWCGPSRSPHEWDTRWPCCGLTFWSSRFSHLKSHIDACLQRSKEVLHLRASMK